MKNLGTPKSMTEAIKRGFTVGSTVIEVVDNVDKNVQDYLTQHFTTAILRCDENDFVAQIILQDLWRQITGKTMDGASHGESQASSIMSEKGKP